MSGEARISTIQEFDAPLEIQTVPLPDPEPGAIVVEMELATLCGSDVHHWEGIYKDVFPMRLPLCSGHEGVGRVVSLGQGSELDSIGEELRVGDRVVWEHEPCGRCYECQILHDEVLCSHRKTGLWRSVDQFPYINGTFGTHSYVWPNSGRLKVRDDIRSEWASAASCAMRTVIPAIEKAGDINESHTVAVQGVGPLGLFAVAILSTRSPKRLIAIGAPDDRLELAREWGATDTISIQALPGAAERKQAIAELTEGRGPDVVFEFAGAGGAFSQALEMAAKDGRVMVIGTAAGPAEEVFAHDITTKQLSVRGSFSGRIDHYWKAYDFMARHRGRFDWDRMITGRFKLSELEAALESMRSGEGIKPVVLTQEL